MEKENQPSSYQELDEETLFIVSQTFKALSDPTRIRILHLFFHGEHSVNEIAEKLWLAAIDCITSAAISEKLTAR